MKARNLSPSQAAIDPASVLGWAVDANPDNDPTYPYRDRSQDDHSAAWVRPTPQKVDVEILKSVEYNARPAVVGTSTPPSGLSGMVRRAAFRKSESNLLHWMGLLGADRINMIEGILKDIGRGRVPNIIGELGGRAELRYNKRGMMIKVLATSAVVALITAAVMQRRHSARRRPVRKIRRHG